MDDIKKVRQELWKQGGTAEFSSLDRIFKKGFENFVQGFFHSCQVRQGGRDPCQVCKAGVTLVRSAKQA